MQQPIVNPQLEVLPFDSDSAEPMALCVLPLASGDHVRYAVPRAVVDLLELFDGWRTVDEAIAAYRQRHAEYHTDERLRQLLDTFLMPKGLVLCDAESRVEIRRRDDYRRSFLYLQLPLITSRLVNPIANACKWAFHRPVMIASLIAFVAMHIYFYGALVPGYDLAVNQLSFGNILMLMLLSTIGTFAHEFGHASAAAFYGCKRLQIGWGLYILFAVLYTDVSDAWKLPRRQRAVVDLGGVYFQSFFLAAMLALFAATGQTIYLFAFLFSDIGIATSFNPFLRLDGYWLLSDAFGILNLRQQSLRLLRRGAGRLIGRKPKGDSGLSRRATAVLAGYSFLSLFFFFYLVKLLYDRVATPLFIAYPEMLADLWLNARQSIGMMQLAGDAMEILWRTLMLAGFGVLLFNVLRTIGKGLARLFSRSAILPSGAPAA